jgi:hypothetical protein
LPCAFSCSSVDQLDCGVEAHLLAVILDRLHADGGGDVRLAGAWLTDQHDVVGTADEVAAVQVADRGLVALICREVEPGQVLVGWEVAGLDLVGDRTHLARGGLGLQQLREDGPHAICAMEESRLCNPKIASVSMAAVQPRPLERQKIAAPTARDAGHCASDTALEARHQLGFERPDIDSPALSRTNELRPSHRVILIRLVELHLERGALACLASRQVTSSPRPRNSCTSHGVMGPVSDSKSNPGSAVSTT